MIMIMISGKQGSGKTTVSNMLTEQLRKADMHVTSIKFADPLYKMHDKVLEVLKEYGIERNIVKDGPLLQLLGTEWGRKTIDQNIWVDLIRNKFEILYSMQSQHVMADMLKKDVVIIDDLRFKNEISAFSGDGVVKIRLECPEDIRKARCSMWRDNTNHPSETDLDECESLFDTVINTSKNQADVVVNAVTSNVFGTLCKGCKYAH